MRIGLQIKNYQLLVTLTNEKRRRNVTVMARLERFIVREQMKRASAILNHNRENTKYSKTFLGRKKKDGNFYAQLEDTAEIWVVK